MIPIELIQRRNRFDGKNDSNRNDIEGTNLIDTEDRIIRIELIEGTNQIS